MADRAAKVPVVKLGDTAAPRTVAGAEDVSTPTPADILAGRRFVAAPN
jgi:hypothetical protein